MRVSLEFPSLNMKGSIRGRLEILEIQSKVGFRRRNQKGRKKELPQVVDVHMIFRNTPVDMWRGSFKRKVWRDYCKLHLLGPLLPSLNTLVIPYCRRIFEATLLFIHQEYHALRTYLSI